MGTITARKRKENSTAYTAQIRINRDGKTVYQESQTFDRKQVARACIKANGQEPYAWLRHVLERLPAATSVENYEALLPWNCSPVSPS